jgi:hypothetical protein
VARASSGRLAGSPEAEGAAAKVVADVAVSLAWALAEEKYQPVHAWFAEAVVVRLLYNLGRGADRLVRLIQTLSADPQSLYRRLVYELAAEDRVDLYVRLLQTIMAGEGTVIQIHGANGDFSVGETVTGAASGAVGTVAAVDGDALVLSDVAGSFAAGEAISGQASGRAATVGAVETAQGRTIFASVAYDVFLDGLSIKGRISGLTVREGEGYPHHEATLSSADPGLFHEADPARMRGAERLEVHVGGRAMTFVIRRRQGTDRDFSFTALSPSCLLAAPFHNEVVFEPASGTAASQAAADLADYAGLTVSWQCEDFPLPDDWSFEGYPLDGLKSLAEAVGGIVASQDDGGLLIAPRLKYRPRAMPAAPPDAAYFPETELFSISYNEANGSGENRITVYGHASQGQAPFYEVENGDYGVGDAVTVRIYWPGGPPADRPATYVTAGAVEFLGQEAEVVADELVRFQDGRAQAARPVARLTKIDWIGDDWPGIDYTPHARGLTLSGATDALGQSYRLARIRYETVYWRYRLAGHDVPELLAALETNYRPGAAAEVVQGAGDRPADPVSAPILTTAAACAARGKAELDNKKWDAKEVAFQAPYRDAVRVRALVQVNEETLGLSGAAHVKSVETTFDGPRVLQSLDVVRLVIPR